MQYFNLNNYDVVFLSYDEPNCDKNYQQLLTKIPRALRVHGIKGSDSAHKECAKISSTDRIIIIDADNYVWGDLLNHTIALDDNIDATKVVFSWPSRNIVNGLLYGNGGIKCWPRQAIFDMRTHENADPQSENTQVDFCWELNYIPIDLSFSDIHNNATELQAFRSGFREGVKMSLDNGIRVRDLSNLDKGNLNRLLTWLSVGADIHNGLWAILGAWHGFYKTFMTEWDYTEVRDFDFLNSYFYKKVSDFSVEQILEDINELRSLVKTRVDIPDPFPSDHSRFFKTFDMNPKRQPPYVMCFPTYTGYDIVMITYDEKDADENYMRLLSRFPSAKRIHGIKGIHQAHIEAAKIVNTDMFWVVDGDAIIEENFRFDFKLDNADDYVRVWRCKNPVNDLVYGYGGVKLLPRQLTLTMDLTKPDMTTSISNLFIPVQELSNTTFFNVDEFSAWRSAFRECCKLSSKVIDRQKDEETIKRLDVWCSVGNDRPFGEYAINGAILGRKYGEENQGNLEALKKINDFEWLKEMFYANT